MAAILNFGSGPTSDKSRQRDIQVGHGRKYRGRTWNHGFITVRSKVISTSGLVAAILNFGSRTTSDKVDFVISKSGMVENMGIKAEIVSFYLKPFKGYCRLRFSDRYPGFPVEGEVGVFRG